MKRKLGPLRKILLGLLGLFLIVRIGVVFASIDEFEFQNRFGIKKSQAFALVALPAIALLLMSPLFYVRSRYYKGPWSKHQHVPMLRPDKNDPVRLIYKGRRVVVEVDRRGKPKPANADDEEENIKGGKDGKS